MRRLPGDYVALQAGVECAEFARLRVQSMCERVVHFRVCGGRRLRWCHFGFLASAWRRVGVCVYSRYASL